MIWDGKADRRYANLKVLINVVTFDSSRPHEKTSNFVSQILEVRNYYPPIFFIIKQRDIIHNTL